MATFTYVGETKQGKKITKTVEVNDRFEVYDIARQEGNTVISVTESSQYSWSNILNTKRIEALISRVKEDELVMVTRNLGSMLAAGLALSRALSVIERQTKNPRLKIVVNDVRERVNKGSTFHDALSAHPKEFNDLYIAMVTAGEESGNLSVTLQTLSKQMQQTSALKKKIKGAMIYPSIVIAILIGIGYLMMIFVMPAITDTFREMDMDLPATTQLLMNISDFMVTYTLLSVAGLVGFVALVIFFLRTYIGKRFSSYVIPRLPMIGLLAKEVNAARSARTLSSLLSSGVDVIRAILITRDVVQNLYYKDILSEVAKRVEKGTPLSEVFIERDDLYPVLVGEMILVGEETGNISNMLKELAEFYEEEVSQKTKDLSTIIEPILMVVIGGTVGFFAIAMLSPIYSITEGI